MAMTRSEFQYVAKWSLKLFNLTKILSIIVHKLCSSHGHERSDMDLGAHGHTSRLNTYFEPSHQGNAELLSIGTAWLWEVLLAEA